MARHAFESAADPTLSPREKLSLVLRFLFLAPPQILLNVTRCYTLALLRGIPLRYFARCALNRFALSLPSRLIQGLLPSTSTAYARWIHVRTKQARKRSTASLADQYANTQLKCDIEPLSDGKSSLLWVGDRTQATKFVYFFHGGGYTVPISPGHLEWCLRAYVAAAASAGGESVAVAVLQYSLCPPAAYPTQLQQAAAGLAHLFESGIRPRDLVVGGDSAGGNLTAQLLGYVLHPHPDVPKITLREPLAGVFAVSPWVSARTDWPSFRTNGSIDMLSPSFLGPAIEKLLGGGASNYEVEKREGKGWAMPADVDTEAWFEGLHGIVKSMYITVGGQEVFLDQCVHFAEAIRRGNPGLDVRFEVVGHEAHDWIMLEGGDMEDGDAMRRMRAWVAGAFWGQD
ncbi:Alpha/Beta hydrolase protein [Echria macrotheca]|uniref:Alpha/Beta hydrolase protein n=1 Tax=Echria macrotheca TaxID=438768 RepID=A0AAJ0F330_9PEZI|nr:Alpha/Beta hydrolase protein [Echria macrotheca]